MEKVRENTLSTVVNHSYITFYIYGLIISLFHIKVTTRSNKPPLLQFRLLSYCIALFSHRHNKITNITSQNDFNVQLVIIFLKYIFQIRICTHLIKIAYFLIKKKEICSEDPFMKKAYDRIHRHMKIIQINAECDVKQYRITSCWGFLQLEVCSYHHKTPYETYITVSISC